MKIGPTFTAELEARRPGLSRLPFGWHLDTGILDFGDPPKLSEKDMADVRAVLAKHDPEKQLPPLSLAARLAAMTGVSEGDVRAELAALAKEGA